MNYILYNTLMYILDCGKAQPASSINLETQNENHYLRHPYLFSPHPSPFLFLVFSPSCLSLPLSITSLSPYLVLDSCSAILSLSISLGCTIRQAGSERMSFLVWSSTLPWQLLQKSCFAVDVTSTSAGSLCTHTLKLFHASLEFEVRHGINLFRDMM